jgi:hypothetical protein
MLNVTRHSPSNTRRLATRLHAAWQRCGSLVLVALGAAALTPEAHAADICKWVDRDGKVHYSDVAPAEVRCAALIRVEHSDPLEGQRAEERRRQLLEQAKAAQAQREKDPQAEAGQARQAAARELRCQAARSELKFLQEAQGMRLVRPAEQGESEALVWIDDNEREQLLQAWRDEVRDWCQAGDSTPTAATPPRPFAVPAPRRRLPAPAPQ